MTGSFRDQTEYSELVFLEGRIMALDKSIKTEYVTASKIVSRSPCWVFAAIASETAADIKKATFINGHDSAGEIKLIVSARWVLHGSIIFLHPVYFSKGLYVEMDSGLDNVFVQFKEVEP